MTPQELREIKVLLEMAKLAHDAEAASDKVGQDCRGFPPNTPLETTYDSLAAKAELRVLAYDIISQLVAYVEELEKVASAARAVCDSRLQDAVDLRGFVRVDSVKLDKLDGLLNCWSVNEASGEK